MSNPADIDALKAAVAALPRLPWKVKQPWHVADADGVAFMGIVTVAAMTDADNFVCVHNALPAMIAEIERLREAVGRVIAETNWCPVCDAHPYDADDHRDGCPMGLKGSE